MSFTTSDQQCGVNPFFGRSPASPELGAFSPCIASLKTSPWESVDTNITMYDSLANRSCIRRGGACFSAGSPQCSNDAQCVWSPSMASCVSSDTSVSSLNCALNPNPTKGGACVCNKAPPPPCPESCGKGACVQKGSFTGCVCAEGYTGDACQFKTYACTPESKSGSSELATACSTCSALTQLQKSDSESWEDWMENNTHVFQCSTDGAALEQAHPVSTRAWCPGDVGCCTGLKDAVVCNSTSNFQQMWLAMYPSGGAACAATRPDNAASDACYSGIYDDTQTLSLENTSTFFPERVSASTPGVSAPLGNLDFESLGLAVSGGGPGSFCATIGYMRALTKFSTRVRQYYSTENYRDANYYEALNYVSTASTGSWFNGVFSAVNGTRKGDVRFTEDVLLDNEMDVFKGLPAFVAPYQEYSNAFFEVFKKDNSLFQQRYCGGTSGACALDAALPEFALGSRIAGFTAAAAAAAAAASAAAPGSSATTRWSDVLGKMLLEPYGSDTDAPFVINAARGLELQAALSTNFRSCVHPYAGAPFWIANGTLTVAGGSEAAPSSYAQLQMTPLYMGTPQVTPSFGGAWVETYAAGAGVQELKGTAFYDRNTFTNMALNQCLPRSGVKTGPARVGLCVSSASYGGGTDQTPSIRKSQALQATFGRQTLDVALATPASVTKLRDILALSSAGFAETPTMAWPMVQGWTVAPTPTPSAPTPVRDGGFIDNLALLPLVARRVRHIVCLWNKNDAPVFINKDAAGRVVQPLPDGSNGCLGLEDLTMYFGVFTNERTPRMVPCEGGTSCETKCVDAACATCRSQLPSAADLAAVKIFNTADMYGILDQLVKTKQSGGPTWARQTLAVLPNARYGVTGGYMLDLLIIMLQPSPDFAASLPASVASALPPGFPNYPAAAHPEFSLTPLEISALALYTQWSLYHPAVRTQLHNMFPHAFNCEDHDIPQNRQWCNPARDPGCCAGLSGEYGTAHTWQQRWCANFSQDNQLCPDAMEACMASAPRHDVPPAPTASAPFSTLFPTGGVWNDSFLQNETFLDQMQQPYVKRGNVGAACTAQTDCGFKCGAQNKCVSCASEPGACGTGGSCNFMSGECDCTVPDVPGMQAQPVGALYQHVLVQPVDECLTTTTAAPPPRLLQTYYTGRVCATDLFPMAHAYKSWTRARNDVDYRAAQRVNSVGDQRPFSNAWLHAMVGALSSWIAIEYDVQFDLAVEPFLQAWSGTFECSATSNTTDEFGRPTWSQCGNMSPNPLDANPVNKQAHAQLLRCCNNLNQWPIARPEFPRVLSQSKSGGAGDSSSLFYTAPLQLTLANILSDGNPDKARFVQDGLTAWEAKTGQASGTPLWEAEKSRQQQLWNRSWMTYSTYIVPQRFNTGNACALEANQALNPFAPNTHWTLPQSVIEVNYWFKADNMDGWLWSDLFCTVEKTLEQSYAVQEAKKQWYITCLEYFGPFVVSLKATQSFNRGNWLQVKTFAKPQTAACANAEAYQDPNPVILNLCAPKIDLFDSSSNAGSAHAVLLVGHCALYQAEYWIVKNAWGTGWGDMGYALIPSNVRAPGTSFPELNNDPTDGPFSMYHDVPVFFTNNQDSLCFGAQSVNGMCVLGGDCVPNTAKCM